MFIKGFSSMFILIVACLLMLNAGLLNADSYNLKNNCSCSVSQTATTIFSKQISFSGGTYHVVATVWLTRTAGTGSGIITLNSDTTELARSYIPTVGLNQWIQVTLSAYVELTKAQHTIAINAQSEGSGITFQFGPPSCYTCSTDPSTCDSCDGRLGRTVTIVRTSCP
ncbi:MAG: hypothetical protein A2Y62_13575 [Candidatus Fischerbacteria bacterium RBG_13_37_8]|uniref:CBM-cenC domain-containing protein n=1 Tax=Candidatus Fischerbacteria bacterium RBG_13_37_8 TaxID=1817863 RepID=A0A1F5V6T7_9BACT|nr:MAG: hypothetical protein A2Y62_13575 [Candidatus Fischerbacteria bacterium RBG_13_37_8]